MTDKYILGGEDGRTPILVDDPLEWARWFDTGNKRVASDWVGGCRVSTVFIGLNHSFSPDHPPLLFETMVFRAGAPGEQQRCSTWDEALEQHQRMVARLNRELSG